MAATRAWPIIFFPHAFSFFFLSQYDASLFYHMISPSKEDVITANGDVAPVTRVGPISLTPSLSIHNAILVPSLSNHLLSVGQVT